MGQSVAQVVRKSIKIYKKSINRGISCESEEILQINSGSVDS